jgi:hypothetical protein
MNERASERTFRRYRWLVDPLVFVRWLAGSLVHSPPLVSKETGWTKHEPTDGAGAAARGQRGRDSG